MDALGGVAGRQQHTLPPRHRADNRLAVGTQGTGPGQLLHQLGSLQVGKDVDGPLQDFQPRRFGGLAVELLAPEKLLLVVVPPAGAADAGEAIHPADHVSPLGGAYQHGKGFAGVAQQQPLTLHWADRHREVQPGGEGAAPGPGGHHHRAAVDFAGNGPDAGNRCAIGDQAGYFSVEKVGTLELSSPSQGEVEAVAVQLRGLVLVHGSDDGGRQPGFNGVDLVRVDPVHLDVGLLPHHQALDQIGFVVVQGQPEGGTALVEQVHAGGGFQLRDDPLKLSGGGPGHLKRRPGRELGAQQAEGAGGMGGCPAADGLPFHERYVDALPGQVIGGRAADHPGANDHHVRSFRQFRALLGNFLGEVFGIIPVGRWGCQTGRGCNLDGQG